MRKPVCIQLFLRSLSGMGDDLWMRLRPDYVGWCYRSSDEDGVTIEAGPADEITIYASTEQIRQWVADHAAGHGIDIDTNSVAVFADDQTAVWIWQDYIQA